MNRLLLLATLLICGTAYAEYRVIPYGAVYATEFTLRADDAATVTSGLTLEAGATSDCRVSEDGSADSNCDTLPTAIGSSNKYLLTVSAAEATGARISYMLSDVDSTDYYAREFVFDTCGNAAARFLYCPEASVPQTGDGFLRIGANGASLTSLATQASVNDVPTVDEFEARTPSAAQLAQLLTDICLNRSILVNNSDFDDVAEDSAEFRNRAGNATVVTVVYGGTTGQDRAVTLGSCN